VERIVSHHGKNFGDEYDVNPDQGKVKKVESGD